MISQFLSDNDPDLRLARRIGRHLEGRTPVSEIDDPLVQLLTAYKQHAGDRALDKEISTRALWEHIDQGTRQSGRASTRISRLPVSQKHIIWAAAACVIIAALIGILYFSFPQSSSLLAEAGPSIEILTLPDGSEVTLRPYSKLYRLEGSQDAASYRLSGEGFFRVTNNSGRTFSVEAGNGKVSVLGTRFNLSSWGNITQIFLEEGSIQFTHLKSRESVILEPGQSSVIAPDTRTPGTSTAVAEEFTDWMHTQLVFNNKPASYVFKELEHHFNIEISAPNDILTISLSSGGLTLEDEEASLEYLGLVLGGSFRSTGPETYTFVPNE